MKIFNKIAHPNINLKEIDEIQILLNEYIINKKKKDIIIHILNKLC